MAEIISTAVALIAAFVLGYGIHAEQQRQQAQRPKTLTQLMREQRVKPYRAEDWPAPDPALFSDAEWDAFTAALREARGDD